MYLFILIHTHVKGNLFDIAPITLGSRLTGPFSCKAERLNRGGDPLPKDAHPWKVAPLEFPTPPRPCI